MTTILSFLMLLFLVAAVSATLYWNRAHLPGVASSGLSMLMLRWHYIWFQLPLWIVIGLSWYSTTTGVVGLMRGGQEVVPTSTFMAVSLLVFAATIMMVRFLKMTFHGLRWKRLVALGGYMFLAFISIIFGFAFYWQNIEARAQTFADARNAIARNVQVLQTSQDALRNLRIGFDDLADSARAYSDEETKAGGQCKPPKGRKYGPRAKFLEDEADRFERIAERISGQTSILMGERAQAVEDAVVEDTESPPPVASNGLDDLKDKLNLLQNLENIPNETAEDRLKRQREFDKINQELLGFESRYNALAGSPTLAGIESELEAAESYYNDPDYRHTGLNPITGGMSTFGCFIPEFSTDIRPRLQSIQALRASELKLEELTIKDGPKATREAFQRLMTTLGNLFGSGVEDEDDKGAEVQKNIDDLNTIQEAEEMVAVGQSPNIDEIWNLINEQAPTELRAADYTPLMFAIVVDTILLLWALVIDHKRRTLIATTNSTATTYEKKWSLSELLGKLKVGSSAGDLALLSDYCIEILGTRYIAVPVDFSPDPVIRDNDKTIDALVQYLSINRLASRRFGNPLAKNEKISDYFTSRGSSAGGRSAYRLWRLPRRVWAEIYGAEVV